MEDIKIKSKLSQKDYIKLNYYITYSKISMIIITAIVVIVLIAVVTLLAISGNPFQFGSGFYFLGMYVFVIVFYIPSSIYFKAKKLFSTNKRLQEEIMYEFSENGIKVTGQSFNSQFDWTKIFKIKKANNLLIIYQDKLVGSLIKLDSLDKNEYDRLKQLIKSKNYNVKL